MNKYIVYQISFGREPLIQGEIEPFDSLDDARKYVENPKNIPNKKPVIYVSGDAFIIQKKHDENHYEFIECIPIKK